MSHRELDTILLVVSYRYRFDTGSIPLSAKETSVSGNLAIGPGSPTWRGIRGWLRANVTQIRRQDAASIREGGTHGEAVGKGGVAQIEHETRDHDG